MSAAQADTQEVANPTLLAHGATESAAQDPVRPMSEPPSATQPPVDPPAAHAQAPATVHTIHAQPQRLPPARAQRIAPARPKEAKPRPEATKGEVPTGPSATQLRRLQTAINEAKKDPSKVGKAMAQAQRLGLIPDEAAPTIQPTAETPPPPPPGPTTETPAAMPAAATAPQEAAAPAQPTVPLIHGLPADKVKAAAEKVHFVVTQLDAFGRAVGWGNTKPEAVKLFAGDAFAFECKGDPRTRLIELGALEVARSLGGDSTPDGRRRELGLLAVTTFGPGLVGYMKPYAKGAIKVVGVVAGFVARKVRGWRG